MPSLLGDLAWSRLLFIPWACCVGFSLSVRWVYESEKVCVHVCVRVCVRV